jgi:hypothetical protein
VNATRSPVATLPAGFVGLVASHQLRATPARVLELLASGSAPWAEGLVERPPAPGLRRYVVDLRLRLGGEDAAMTTFRKAAYLDVGTPVRTDDGWDLDISWRAATGAPLFPVFAGKLVVQAGTMRIEGIYAPPGGVIGRVADRVLLHVAANATARWLLAEIDRAAVGAAA